MNVSYLTSPGADAIRKPTTSIDGEKHERDYVRIVRCKKRPIIVAGPQAVGTKAGAKIQGKNEAIIQITIKRTLIQNKRVMITLYRNKRFMITLYRLPGAY